jgi:hypothetical protein
MSADTERTLNFLIDEAASDYIGLYEVVWDLLANAPAVDTERRVEAAKMLVRKLLDLHGAALFVTSKRPPLEWQPVSQGEWNSVLEQPESWVAPESSVSPNIYWVAI